MRAPCSWKQGLGLTFYSSLGCFAIVLKALLRAFIEFVFDSENRSRCYLGKLILDFKLLTLQNGLQMPTISDYGEFCTLLLKETVIVLLSKMHDDTSLQTASVTIFVYFTCCALLGFPFLCSI